MVPSGTQLTFNAGILESRYQIGTLKGIGASQAWEALADVERIFFGERREEFIPCHASEENKMSLKNVTHAENADAPGWN